MDDKIVWFPGHMAKAKRKMIESLSLVDIVIELLDARLPDSSRNPDFLNIFASKPCLTLLTKSGLADDNATERWISNYAQKGETVIAIDCKNKKNLNKIMPSVREILKEKLERYEQKGMNKIIRAMVVGITNVGKSTFINTVTGTKKAKAEDRPGVTRANQWIPSEMGVEFLDTPGVLWHKFDDRQVGIKLACTGAIRDEILDMLELSIHLLDMLREKYPQYITERYKTELIADESSYDLFLRIAKKRGFIRSGGVIDEDRCASVLLDEFRGGLIGKITLD
ncbi:MAG: ribosome biogenesis GTPase YlqF [Clostridiales bacterium GWF2_36_10]|nr:MAG: ribosome biogenesis GTPase YlqF [Clostridiales bacterium GWF2_36_10]HAN20571.1 ribosome biogenesis GTPase YlqF [Clostridiales bacterium]